jgi:hypothetical protein
MTVRNWTPTRTPTRVASALVSGLVLILAACGGTRSNFNLPVGSDETDGGAFLGSDAGGADPLDATIQENHVAIKIVTLSCEGDCADVQAVATGGRPPYVFAWEDGSISPTRKVCPTASTSYQVKVTDSAVTGEVPRPAETVTVPLTADVLACTGPTAGCDDVALVSLAGANPVGPWSYGFSNTLGATFSRYAQFFSGVDIATFAMADAGTAPLAWSSGMLGSQLNPGAYYNATGASYVSGGIAGSTTAQARQFWLHPGPSGQYSIARWTAATGGTFDVQATFVGIVDAPFRTTTDDHVQHDGTDLPAGSGSLNLGANPMNSFSVAARVTVVAGDTIDFAVGNGGNTYAYDSTGLSATVCGVATGDGG